MNEKLKELMAKVKQPKMLMILGICGIVLIGLSSLFPKRNTASVNTDSAKMTAEEYRLMLEDRVRQVVTDITGDKNAAVIVTLDSGFRYSYADSTNCNQTEVSGQSSEQITNNTQHSYITMRSSDGGEQALLVTEMMPEVRGVAIICAGGEQEEISDRIRSAVMAALDLTSKRVYVTGGTEHEKR